MKRKILFFIPILFLGLNFLNLFFLNNLYNEKINLEQDDKIIGLSLGNRHSGAIIDTTENGAADTLYMWGDNSFGQIGDGATENIVLSPKVITPIDQTNWKGNIIDIDLGGNHSGITVDTDLNGYADTLYMWGDNTYGQLGDETTINKSIPTKITPQDQEDWDGNIIDLSLGMYCSGITVDTDLDNYADTLYMWGNNYLGQIGDGISENIVLSPKIITPQDQEDWDGNIIDLSLGGNHSGVIIDTDLDNYGDTLYMWGCNCWGQIGDSSTNNKYIPTKIIPETQESWDGNIIDLDLNLTDSGIIIDSDLNGYGDTLYMWGNNEHSQIGDGTITDRHTPTIIIPEGQQDWNGNIIELSLGENHSGVTVDTNDDGYADTLYMWGKNNYGQIGDGTTYSYNLFPIIITPKGQNDWNGNIIELSLGIDHTGIIIDINNDGYGDMLYMWGKNDCGQIGDGKIDDQNYPNIIISNRNFTINDVNFYINHNIEINITLNDYQNIIDQEPELILVDQNNNQYTTTFIESKSNIENDQYYYQLNNTSYGENYNFTDILINNNQFSLNENIKTDYIISDYNFISSTEETTTINLNLNQNSDNFDISDYTENQRKMEVNYTDIDNEVSNSQQFILDQTSEITLINLNAETNYRIDSINYFYEDNNYKYTIAQEENIFQTSAATPLINADSISLIENSVTTDSFQYTIEVNNLKENSNKDNFTQYDINNGIWLTDDEGISYHSSFINKSVISNGEIKGTQNYQLTFLQEDLLPDKTYDFIGIGFDNPNKLNLSDNIFSSQFEVKTVSVNKNFVDNTFEINSDSIAENSFEYNIIIDNLILIDNTEKEPIFSNFNLDEGLYLIDNNKNSYFTNYVENSAIKISENKETGTVKYQFSFKISNLKSNTKYNFISLSFTNNFREASNISEKGTITTENNDSEQRIILAVIILIIFILLILSLVSINLLMKKKIKKIS